ncbi:MAG: hypothetical protein EXR02_00215 [Rhodospirillales bacterium]|nr:hypothetical protein [Rhodospirillales bacterium]MSP79482.1 hypothetical protein [Rhodospirillales bacterium]
MGLQTNLEIMVQQNGRWTIHARFPVSKKDTAVEEAKSLEKTPGISAVKVVKDVYDQARGSSSEYIIYKSAGLKMETAPAKTAPGRTAPPQPRASSYAEAEPEPSPRGPGGAAGGQAQGGGEEGTKHA